MSNRSANSDALGRAVAHRQSSRRPAEPATDFVNKQREEGNLSNSEQAGKLSDIDCDTRAAIFMGVECRLTRVVVGQEVPIFLRLRGNGMQDLYATSSERAKRTLVAFTDESLAKKLAKTLNPYGRHTRTEYVDLNAVSASLTCLREGCLLSRLSSQVLLDAWHLLEDFSRTLGRNLLGTAACSQLEVRQIYDKLFCANTGHSYGLRPVGRVPIVSAADIVTLNELLAGAERRIDGSVMRFSKSTPKVIRGFGRRSRILPTGSPI